MPLLNMYKRIVPPVLPKVGDEKTIPTGPMEAVTGIITAVDPEGVFIVKLPSGTRLVGYYAKGTGAESGTHRMRDDGSAAPPDEEIWVYSPIER